MVAIIISFVLGIFLGGVIMAIVKRPKPVGTLQITYADESMPYMSLSLDKDVSYIRSKKRVSMKIREIYTDLYEE